MAHNPTMTAMEGARRFAHELDEKGVDYQITVYDASGKIWLNTAKPVNWYGSGVETRENGVPVFVNLHSALAIEINLPKGYKE